MPHIGTAMQSVINRALANKTQGTYILRIEDTDQARTVPGAIENIVDVLKWLGATPNEGYSFGGDYGPYIQSARLHIYQLAAEHLISTGKAYRCFCSEQRLTELREAQTKAKMMPKYDGKCRSLSADEVKAKLAEYEKSNIKPVVRLKMPPAGTKIKFVDAVRGEIEFDAKVLDDQILIKSDGFPTYHLAVVVDDHFMRVTSVVRGEEWISSTPKHVLTYQAFGWQAPRFIHTVLLRNEEKKKLSKRDGDTSATWFRVQGYLPEGFRNFLTRVVWAHPGNRDIYSLDEFAELMTPAALPSTGPVVDMKLLGFINSKYIGGHTGAELRMMLQNYLEFLLESKQLPDLPDEGGVHELNAGVVEKVLHEVRGNPAHVERVLSLEPERHQKLSDILFNCAYFFDSTFMPPKAEVVAKICPDAAQAKALIAEVAAGFNPQLDHEAWDKSLRAIAAAHGVKDKVVFMLTRVAITGQERTPPLYEIIHLLGEERTRARLAGFMALPQPQPSAALFIIPSRQLCPCWIEGQERG
jgi:glutamyl-tRNA synthetase